MHLLRFPQAFKVRAVGVRPGITVLQSAQPLLHVDLRVIHVVERRFCILFRDFPVCHLLLQRVHVLRLRSGSLLHVCGEAALCLLQGALVIILCLRQERPLLRVAVAQLCQQLVDKLQDALSQRPVLLHHGADALLVGQQVLFHILRHDLRINGCVVRQVLAVPRIQFRLLLPHSLQVSSGLPDAVQYQLLQIAVASACLDAVCQFVADDLCHRVLAACVDIDFPVCWVVVAVVHSSSAIRAFVEEYHLAPHNVGDALYLGDGVLVHARKNARAFRFRLGSRSSLPRFRLFRRRQNAQPICLHGLSQRRSLAFLLRCALLRLRFCLLSCRQFRSAGLFRRRQHHAFRLFLSGSGLSCSRFRLFQHSGGLRKQSADLRIRQLLALVQLVLQLLSQLVCLAVFIKGLRRLDDAVHHLVAHLAQRAAGLLVSGVSLHRSDAHTRRGHGAAGQCAAEEVQPHLRRLLRHCKAEGFALRLALRHICVYGLLPLALVLGDEDVGKQVDEVAAHFLRAFRERILQDIFDGSVFPLAFQQRLDAELLCKHFRRTRDGSQRERLCVCQSSILRCNGGIRRRTGAHNGKRHSLAQCAASAESARDRSIQQEVAHTHAGLVQEAARLSPVPALFNGLRHLIANGIVCVGKAVVRRILVDASGAEIVRRLCEITQSLHRGSQHAEHAAAHR